MLIECIDLIKKYEFGDSRVSAVPQGALSVAGGDCVVILGHAGSGKTTLLLSLIYLVGRK